MLSVERLKQRLLTQRKALLRQVAHVEEDLQWLETNVEIEAEEKGQEENLVRLLDRLDSRGKLEIEAIDGALARIAAGDYGRCVSCGELIPEARLETLPTAAMCVPCAAESERRQ